MSETNDTAAAVRAYDELLHEMAARTGFNVRAFVFVHEALGEAVDAREEPGHVSASEVATKVREIATTRFGLLAREVLRHWGIHSTGDLGRVVEVMCETGVLHKSEEDRFEDFEELYDFEQVFEKDYRIGQSMGARSSSKVN